MALVIRVIVVAPHLLSDLMFAENNCESHVGGGNEWLLRIFLLHKLYSAKLASLTMNEWLYRQSTMAVTVIWNIKWGICKERRHHYSTQSFRLLVSNYFLLWSMLGKNNFYDYVAKQEFSMKKIDLRKWQL